MKVQDIKDTTNLKTVEEVVRFVSPAIGDIISVVNGHVDLIDNCDTKFITVKSDQANQNVKVAHTLSRIPKGYIVVGNSVNQTIYDGTDAPDDKFISIRMTGVGTVKLLVF